MFRRLVLALALLLPAAGAPGAETAFAPPAATPAFATVKIPPLKTFIYLGSVHLILAPLHRQDGVYTAGYEARVFPYFFFDEAGRFSIAMPDADLQRLARGEPVDFSGEAQTTAGSVRRIAGRAAPDGAHGGRVKVRVFVTKNIQLIFNGTYRFTAP